MLPCLRHPTRAAHTSARARLQLATISSAVFSGIGDTHDRGHRCVSASIIDLWGPLCCIACFRLTGGGCCDWRCSRLAASLFDCAGATCERSARTPIFHTRLSAFCSGAARTYTSTLFPALAADIPIQLDCAGLIDRTEWVSSLDARACRAHRCRLYMCRSRDSLKDACRNEYGRVVWHP